MKKIKDICQSNNHVIQSNLKKKLACILYD